MASESKYKIEKLTVMMEHDLFEFARSVYKLAHEQNKRISAVTIQYNKGCIKVGSVKNGRFDPCFNIDTDILKSKLYLLMRVMDIIKKYNRVLGYNIFYHNKKDESNIDICKLAIGNMGIERCRFFDRIHQTNVDATNKKLLILLAHRRSGASPFFVDRFPLDMLKLIWDLI